MITDLFLESRKKGKAGYIRSMRIRKVIFTILLFALPIGLYIIGRIQTGTNKNLFTVVAILGCLPAGMSAVNMILFFLNRPVDPRIVTLTEEAAPSLIRGYELVVTGYEKTTPLDSVAVCGDELVCYSSSKKADPSYFQKQVKEIMTGNHLKGVNVKLFTEEKKYLERIRTLEKRGLSYVEEKTEMTEEEQKALEIRKKEEMIFAVLKAISL